MGLASNATAQAVNHYTVRVAPDLESVQVGVCFQGRAPAMLVAHHRHASRYISQIEVQSGGPPRRLQVQGNRIHLTDLTPEACLRYRVELGRLPGKWRRGAGGFKVGNDLLLSPQLFLWYPSGATTPPIELSFILPQELTISAPWRALKESPGRMVYALGDRPQEWDARVALGRFRSERVRIGRQALRLAILDGQSAPRDDKLRLWVKDAATALTQVYGRLPVDDPQVLVVPIGTSSEPVPWGQVMRGGGDAVHVYVDETRPLEEFLADWTLFHEMSHLLHPRLHWRDSWLSEGLASYYQNLLQSRRARISPRAAWAKLHAGFQRGINGTPEDLTLAQATENMMREGLFMRVYWSGAAVALIADAELRARTAQRQSLDTVLAGLAECCLPADRIWSGREFMERLDAISGTQVFGDLYREYADSTDFPDIEAVYRRLGLAERRGELRLDDQAPDAEVRRAIMAPSQERLER